MAERLADVAAQIQNVRQLDSVVTAMRGIAASRAQKGRSLLAAIGAYADAVSRAIGTAMSLQPADAAASVAPPSRGAARALVIFGAEQGFAGAFSERVFDAVADSLDGATLLLVGTRAGTVASERRIEPAWKAPMATRVDAIPSLANRLAEALYAKVAGGVGRVDLAFARWRAGSGIAIDRHSVLPFDYRRFARPPAAVPPLTTLTPDVLLERLAAEYVYAQLCEAAMCSFEAENEARMDAMTAARSNIEDKLAALGQRQRHLRQEEITTEIVELASGAAAAGTRGL
jgi:F-type H+-transporting ATPase subunit gamma